jgi:hypothetical protein
VNTLSNAATRRVPRSNCLNEAVGTGSHSSRAHGHALFIVERIPLCGMPTTWHPTTNVLKDVDRFAYLPPTQAHVHKSPQEVFRHLQQGTVQFPMATNHTHCLFHYNLCRDHASCLHTILVTHKGMCRLVASSEGPRSKASRDLLLRFLVMAPNPEGVLVVLQHH